MNTSFLGLAVATVLTACGIETCRYLIERYVKILLQQYLPLAVLKQVTTDGLGHVIYGKLQQYLPLAVLKLDFYLETERLLDRCNSTYRLRY